VNSVLPEWFSKGNALNMRGHGDPLIVPAFGEDGGEEAEIVAAYMIGPRRPAVIAWA